MIVWRFLWRSIRILEGRVARRGLRSQHCRDADHLAFDIVRDERVVHLCLYLHRHNATSLVCSSDVMNFRPE